MKRIVRLLWQPPKWINSKERPVVDIFKVIFIQNKVIGFSVRFGADLYQIHVRPLHECHSNEGRRYANEMRVQQRQKWTNVWPYREHVLRMVDEMRLFTFVFSSFFFGRGAAVKKFEFAAEMAIESKEQISRMLTHLRRWLKEAVKAPTVLRPTFTL